MCCTHFFNLYCIYARNLNLWFHRDIMLKKFNRFIVYYIVSGSCVMIYTENFFLINLLKNWVMVGFESIWLSFSGSNWLDFLRMNQSDSTYMRHALLNFWLTWTRKKILVYETFTVMQQNSLDIHTIMTYCSRRVYHLYRYNIMNSKFGLISYILLVKRTNRMKC